MRKSRRRRHGLLTPGRALQAVALGHTAWGLTAYRSPLAEIGRAGVIDSVGDGLFRAEHSDGPRAAAFWFLFVGPMLGLLGDLVERADRAGDGRALVVSGWGVLALGTVGQAVVPRSGFPLTFPLAGWLVRRGRALGG